MLWRLVGEPGGAPPSRFSDVPGAAWYHAALDWAVANGLVTGFPGGTFRPRDPVNRGQIAAIVFNLAGDGDAWSAWPDGPLSTWRFA